MPVVANPYAGPSNLAVVLRAIVQAFQERGDTTPVMVGEHYATNPQGMGSPPCVILVPEPDGGACELSAPYETGRAAKQVHVCDVLVRAAEPGDDIDRFANAYDLSDLVAATVRRTCSGRLTFGRSSKPYPTPFGVDSGAGVQISWGFTFDRDIAMAPAVLAVRVDPATGSAHSDAEPTDADTDPIGNRTEPYASAGDTGSFNGLTGGAYAQE